ncbi:phenylacetate--CoA ligase, partial [Streptomyces sp. TRM76130]|nr:phenylacetate--CoA ligase [Streptomyces sp. TRM76130]
RSRRGESVPADLLDDAERMPRQEVEALQLRRLRRTLRHAYDRVELYRRKFDQAGVTPEDCRTSADLARFP